MHARYSTRKAVRNFERADTWEMTDYDIVHVKVTKAAPFKRNNYFLLIECSEFKTIYDVFLVLQAMGNGLGK